MPDINAYTGKNIADRLDGIEKECYLAAWEWMEYAWGANVEFQRLHSQVLLCDETRERLYGGDEPKLRYVRGSRPALDKIGDEICQGLQTEREKVLAILCYIRDMHKKVGGADYFYGGTEEELIKKSEWFCERVARVMVALCETQGIVGRIVFHIGAGHLTNEIYLEGGSFAMNTNSSSMVTGLFFMPSGISDRRTMASVPKRPSRRPMGCRLSISSRLPWTKANSFSSSSFSRQSISFPRWRKAM